MTREEFIQGLREVADFVEAHPTLPTPGNEFVINVWLDEKQEVLAAAKLTNWKKIYMDQFFWLQKMFGPGIRYEINVPRERVCRRVSTGKTHVVPATPEVTVEDFKWVCDEPLLQPTPREQENTDGQADVAPGT